MAKGDGSSTFLEGALQTEKKNNGVRHQELMNAKKKKTTGKKSQRVLRKTAPDLK